jgi:ABC-type transporter Mla MlaB component
MLRISEPTANHATTLKLEGRLVGPWVSQLREICEVHLAQERRVKLDFTDVTYADRSGVSLLLDLRVRGVELVNCSPFLIEELKAGA